MVLGAVVPIKMVPTSTGIFKNLNDATTRRDMVNSVFRQEATNCEIKFNTTVKADYPTSNLLEATLGYSGDESCVGEPGFLNYTVDIGQHFQDAATYGLTVNYYRADTDLSATIDINIPNDNEGSVTVNLKGYSSEESKVTDENGTYCEIAISVVYDFDYTVSWQGQDVQYSGTPDVVTNSSANCFDSDGNPVSIEQNFVDGILAYAGTSSSDSFSIPSGGFVVPFVDPEAVSQQVSENIKDSVSGNLQQAEGTLTPTPTSTAAVTSSPTPGGNPTPTPVCVEVSYIEKYGLERVHEQDSYAEVLCITGSTLPCGTADHLLEVHGSYVSYSDYCKSHACTQKMAYVNGIRHSQAHKLVHDNELKLTTMTSRTNQVGLYMTGLMQRHGIMLDVLDNMQRHKYW
eukprot:CAMPEP_0184701382 /NCGR_PEP_ID=MMETSP0313-20130426/19625_1 /TAXON_ID=2792 /ORGANISM="Porphyridium aerugineum, Strain SAG 1380-2" /LENGTH=401 /DNA_ID=CAMNT_0027161425 /DNA_START=179 /DNA_END=1384 /DNA_ORIENTATION=-